ncbi:uncharacterized protein V1518DRAFT_414145 [Limtongia smithiae]|uniref:uncharacterized protein n=1 Tax=Limtongia smithiae TaxID=1125753 RepID=UPI0034CF5ABA
MSRRPTGTDPPRPRRATANPAPRTEAAKQALRSFYCDLCSKGYSRMDEYDTHISSYEHQHKKRFNELRHMQRDPSTAQQRREREMNEAGMHAIALNSKVLATGRSSGGGGFKRVTGASSTPAVATASTSQQDTAPSTQEARVAEQDSDSEGEISWDRYDPGHPTD